MLKQDQTAFKFDQDFKSYAELTFCKFINHLGNELNPLKIIGFCYSKGSKNEKIYNDLYCLQLNQKIDFKLSIAELQKQTFCIYISDYDYDVAKTIKEYYIKALEARQIKYHYEDGQFLIDFQELTYNPFRNYENDKTEIEVYSFLDFPIDFYTYIIDKVDIFNLKNYFLADLPEYKLNPIFSFDHSNEVKYFNRQEFITLVC
jgi:hypothetical protein